MTPVTLATARVDVEAAESLAAVAQVDRLAAAGRGAGGSDGATDRPAREVQLGLDGRAGRGCPRSGGRSPG